MPPKPKFTKEGVSHLLIQDFMAIMSIQKSENGATS